VGVCCCGGRDYLGKGDYGYLYTSTKMKKMNTRIYMTTDASQLFL
jgi:hypothetical protein